MRPLQRAVRPGIEADDLLRVVATLCRGTSQRRAPLCAKNGRTAGGWPALRSEHANRRALKPDVDGPRVLQRGFSEVIRSKWWRGKLEGCPCSRCANEPLRTPMLPCQIPAFCVAKGCCECLSSGNRFAQWSLTVRFLTFGVVTPC
jgi:hypothetical protein